MAAVLRSVSAFLAIALANGCEPCRADESAAPDASYIRLIPVQPGIPVIDIAKAGCRVEVYRTDFKSRGLHGIELAVYEAQGNECRRVLTTKVPLEPKSKTTSGTLYVTVSLRRVDDSTSGFVHGAITTRNQIGSQELTDLSWNEAVALEIVKTYRRAVTIPKGREQVFLGLSWTGGVKPEGETLDQLLATATPLDVFTKDAIVESVKRMDRRVVLFATVKATPLDEATRE